MITKHLPEDTLRLIYHKPVVNGSVLGLVELKYFITNNKWADYKTKIFLVTI